MSAYSIPMICEPLSGQTVDLAKNRYDFLSDLHLADYSREAGPAEVDILIGSEQYWQLVTGRVRRGNSGPMALHTRLGWVLSGPVEDPTHDSGPSVNLVSSKHVLRCASEPTNVESLWGYQALNSQSTASSPTLSPFSVVGMRYTCPGRTLIRSYLTTTRQASDD